MNRRQWAIIITQNVLVSPWVAIQADQIGLLWE